MKLSIDSIKKTARFFFLEVKIAVARYAKRGRGEHFVSVIQPFSKGVDHVVKKHVFHFAFLGRQQNQARQRTRYRHDAEKCLRAAPLFLQQKRHAQRLVQYVRERMRRINRHRRKQRLNSFAVEIFDVFARRRAQLRPTQHSNGFFCKGGHQYVAPAFVLPPYKLVNLRGQVFQHLFRNLPIGSGIANSVLHLLQQPGHAHFHKLVKIARGDGQKLYALKDRIGLVTRLFQDSVIELHPGKMPIEDVLGVRYCIAVHRIPEARESTAEVLQPCYDWPYVSLRGSERRKRSQRWICAPVIEGTSTTIANCE